MYKLLVTKRARAVSAVLMSIIFVAAFISVFQINNVSAASGHPYNQSEVDAKNKCGDGKSRRGAIWFNNGSYYDGSVSISGDATTVDVKIRGSVYSCSVPGIAKTGAKDVKPDGENKDRLTDLSSHELERGTVKGKKDWSSKGGSISAKLDVSGLATDNKHNKDVPGCNGSTSYCQRITIDLYRCFYNYTTKTKGDCYSDPVKVDIIREIPKNYILTPKIDLNLSGAIEAGATFMAGATVTNSKNGDISTDSAGTKWQLTKIIVNPGMNNAAANTGGGESSDDPCDYFRSAAVNLCLSVDSKSNVVFSKNSSTKVSNHAESDTDQPIGTKICYALSVQPRAYTMGSEDSRWAHSPLACLTIGKKPKVQIWGGDLVVGGLVQTSNSTKTIGGVSQTFGSWDEYGILAVRSISGMGSGSAFAGPGLSNAAIDKYSSLSFANASNPNCVATLVGCYNTARTLPDVAASFSSGETIAVGSIKANDLMAAAGTYIGTRSGNLSLDQSELSPGKTIVIKVDGTVTINGNQSYNLDNNGAGYTNISQLPQLLIIANNINIVGGVTNVDAWLIASGKINTCSSVADNANLDSATCDQQLTVNGPVVADKLYLRRTFGSGMGNNSGDPAETFNLRADAYLWSVARAEKIGHVQTVHTTELPPRY